MRKDKKGRAARVSAQMPRSRSRGQAIVVLVLFLSAALLVAGLVTDIGAMAALRQRIKRAADAAALAGAKELPSENAARSQAWDYASRNGFTEGANGVSVVTLVNPTGQNANWFRVTITAPFSFFLGRIIGLGQTNITIFSTAQFNSYVPISINLAGIYGQSNPSVTLGVRGRETLYEHGDPYSVPLLDNGDPNPLYDPNGYNYKLIVPEDYQTINGTSMMKVQIWDPDSYGNYDSSGTRTTTVYSLYAPDSTPKDYSDDVLVATYTKGGDSSTSSKWITPTGFTLDTTTFGTGTYRINVHSLSGYNANGFTLRAGPTTSTFDPNNGTKIMAQGPMPIRFNDTGDVVMELGYVPASAAGTRMHINKFDTEIGSTSVIYSCSALPDTWPGELAENSTWKEDVIDIPSGYAGGVWYATYYAGETDFSLWSMWYEGMEADEAGFVALVE